MIQTKRWAKCVFKSTVERPWNFKVSLLFKMVYGNGNTCISEERLTVLMKKIFAEELEKQQQNLLKSISSYFEIKMKEIKNIQCEVNELKKSIEFTEEVLEEEVQNMQSNVSSLEEKVDEIYDYQIDPDEVEKKLTDLQDHSRRNNLRIDGFAEENNKTWDDCERKVKDIFMDKLELENDIITERAYRTKKKKQIWQEGSTWNNSV